MIKEEKSLTNISLNFLLENDSFVDFAKEVVLQSLKNANDKLIKLEELGDISGVEILEKEFVKKYEKLYTILDSDEIKEIFSHNKNNIEFQNNAKLSDKKEKIMTIIEGIMTKNGYTQEEILLSLEKRGQYGVDSASIVVKNLYEYELKEVEVRRKKILTEANIILRNLDELNLQLSNSIQQINQEKIIEQLYLLQQKYKVIDSEILRLERIKIKLEKTLESKWKYEIYGTLHKNRLKESLNMDKKI